MALGAGIDSQFLFGRTGFECVTTGHAGNFGAIIFRMDIFFHEIFPLTIRLGYVIERIKQVKLYHNGKAHTRKFSFDSIFSFLGMKTLPAIPAEQFLFAVHRMAMWTFDFLIAG